MLKRYKLNKYTKQAQGKIQKNTNSLPLMLILSLDSFSDSEKCGKTLTDGIDRIKYYNRYR